MVEDLDRALPGIINGGGINSTWRRDGDLDFRVWSKYYLSVYVLIRYMDSIYRYMQVSDFNDFRIP